VFVKTNGRLYTATISMNISFLAPAKVGPIIGEATVVQLGKTVVFMEGRLMDQTGQPLATGPLRMLGWWKRIGPSGNHNQLPESCDSAGMASNASAVVHGFKLQIERLRLIVRGI
jgi:hypothetical protein